MCNVVSRVVSCGVLLLGSPVVVFGAEQAVEDLAQGAEVVQVVQDEHQGQVLSLAARAAAALIRQLAQVLTKLLHRTTDQ